MYKNREEYLAKLTRPHKIMTRNPQVAERARTRIGQVIHGLHVNGPLTCRGPEQCPIHDSCPIAIETPAGGVVAADLADYPVNDQCLLEDQFLRHQIAQYMNTLGVEPDDVVEMSIVRELGLIDLQKQRALLIMSQGDRRGDGRDFMSLNVKTEGISPNGDVLVSEELVIHPLVDFIGRLENRRERWLTKLIATRKDQNDARAKIGKKDNGVELNTLILEMAEHLRDTASKKLETSSEQLIRIDEDFDDR